jgi:mono/diheme cytochrome c family protein
LFALLAAARAHGDGAAGDCDTESSTPQAPEAYWFRENPLDATPANIAAGKRLYEEESRPIPCASCHGIGGKGDGEMSSALVPEPTNFTCRERMRALTDGHVFWLVEEGSGVYSMVPGHLREGTKRPGRRPRYTAMRGHRNYLTEEQIWQLVLYLRTFDGGQETAASAPGESGR